MEMKIFSPDEDVFVKEIEFNHAELKAELEQRLEKYQNLVYTDATIAEAKQDRAKLNKFKQALDAKRKEIKAQCLAPYEAFEAKVKELLALVDKPALAIDAQVKTYEEKKRAEKRAHIVEFWDAQESDVKDLVALDAIFDQRWLNVTYAIGKIETEITEFLAKVKDELALLHELDTEFEEQVVRVYLQDFNVAKAMAENKALLEQKARREEYQHKQEEAAAQAKEEERRRAEVAAKPDPEPEKPVRTVPLNRPAPVQEPPATRMVDFRVWATPDQLAGLKQYLNDNDIQYGPVPNEKAA